MNPNIRIGHGYDCHRLALPPEGGPLVLGGLHIEHKMGPVAHSDGDALLHAVTDAVLGALGLDDLGTQFPDNDPRWQGAAGATCKVAGKLLLLAGATGNAMIHVLYEIACDMPAGT